MGWEFDPKEAHHWTSRGRWVKPPSGELVFRHAIPDYFNNLNAMHEAEALLDYDGQVAFVTALCPLVGLTGENNYWYDLECHEAWKMVNATAAQRAEAYLKTIGKWQQETRREDGAES